METMNNQQMGKSRLINENMDKLPEDSHKILLNNKKPKFSFVKIGLSFFIVFILFMTSSVIYRVAFQDTMVDPNLIDDGEEVVLEVDKNEVDLEDEDDLFLISGENIEYEKPERIYHIEKQQQFCAKDVDQARKLYSNYINVKNQQILEVKPSNVSTQQWIDEKKLQGVYRENLGEREREYYFEYPTTAGLYVDLMRIYKCETFNPEGRIIPITSVEEDGYIPEHELGVIGLENLLEDDLSLFVQYLISLRHDKEKIIDIRKKSSGDYFTMTMKLENNNLKQIDLKKSQVSYQESIYKVNLKTGILKYSSQLLIEDIINE